jgi:hypothetical protein
VTRPICEEIENNKKLIINNMKNEKLDMGKVRKGVKCYQKVFKGEPYNED